MNLFFKTVTFLMLCISATSTKAAFPVLDQKEHLSFLLNNDIQMFQLSKASDRPLDVKKNHLMRIFSDKYSIQMVLKKINDGYYNLMTTANERENHSQWLTGRIDFINQRFAPYFDAENCIEHIPAIEAMTEAQVNAITFEVPLIL
jgi:hypothetical protein